MIYTYISLLSFELYLYKCIYLLYLQEIGKGTWETVQYCPRSIWSKMSSNYYNGLNDLSSSLYNLVISLINPQLEQHHRDMQWYRCCSKLLGNFRIIFIVWQWYFDHSFCYKQWVNYNNNWGLKILKKVYNIEILNLYGFCMFVYSNSESSKDYDIILFW